jgi:hypothetical protein
MRQLFCLMVVVIALLSGGCAPSALTPVRGTVKDSKGLALKSVIVTVSRQGTTRDESIPCETHTDEKGTYRCDSLPRERFKNRKAYSVKFEKIGFKEFEKAISYTPELPPVDAVLLDEGEEGESYDPGIINSSQTPTNSRRPRETLPD